MQRVVKLLEVARLAAQKIFDKKFHAQIRIRNGVVHQLTKKNSLKNSAIAVSCGGEKVLDFFVRKLPQQLIERIEMREKRASGDARFVGDAFDFDARDALFLK